MSTVSLKSLMLFCLLAFLTANITFGQATNDYGSGPGNKTEDATIEDVPPPLISLSKTEAEQLQMETDFKKRTQLCLALADTRLQKAEKLTNDADFHNALTELGAYQAIIANGIKFLQAGGENKKVRDNIRRLEMNLRIHVPRIEFIRRSTPSEYAVHIKGVLNFARDTRSRALEAFFDDTVLSENSGGIKQSSAASSSNGLSFEKKPD
jgi:hypothetical protein